MRWMVLLLIVVPALEIWILFETGSRIGGWQTFGLVLLTGFLGAWLARREARRVFDYARFELSRGVIPTASILDAICVFVGGVMLLTPGFVTDLAGLLLVIPATRLLLKRGMYRIIQRMIDSGRIRFYF